MASNGLLPCADGRGEIEAGWGPRAGAGSGGSCLGAEVVGTDGRFCLPPGTLALETEVRGVWPPMACSLAQTAEGRL